jgi:hypothetical protein
MNFRISERWKIIPVAEMPWPGAHPLIAFGISEEKLAWWSWRNWVRTCREDDEGLEFDWEASSDCLQTLTLKKSEQQQLDKIFISLISCHEKIVKRNEAFLLSDPFTTSSGKQANYLSWRKPAPPKCLVQFLPLDFRFNKYSRNTLLLVSSQSTATSQILNRNVCILILL